MHDGHRGFNAAGSQVLENLSKNEGDKSAEMLAFLIRVVGVRKVLLSNIA